MDWLSGQSLFSEGVYKLQMLSSFWGLILVYFWYRFGSGTVEAGRFQKFAFKL